MYAIQVQGAEKQYKNGVQALSDFSLSVKSGEIFSLLGSNGAGKSTLIRILTTYLKPSSGIITIRGKDIYRDAAAIRAEIACVTQQTSLDTYLSLEENMMFQSRLYGIAKKTAKNKMEELIADFALHQYRKYPVSSYSGGVKRRLDIALNLMSNPKILFLDEPTVGMDIRSRMAMWEMMKKIRDDFGTTIFLTTHYLEEADGLSDTICIMKDGKKVKQGAPAALRAYLHQDVLQVRFRTSSEAKRYSVVLQALHHKTEILTKNSQVIFNVDDSRSAMEKTAQFLLQEHIPFYGIEITQPTLEDIFLRLTANDKRE